MYIAFKKVESVFKKFMTWGMDSSVQMRDQTVTNMKGTPACGKSPGPSPPGSLTKRRRYRDLQLYHTRNWYHMALWEMARLRYQVEGAYGAYHAEDDP